MIRHHLTHQQYENPGQFIIIVCNINDWYVALKIYGNYTAIKVEVPLLVLSLMVIPEIKSYLHIP